MTSGSPAREMTFTVDEMTTGIIGADGSFIESSEIYNLSGQKVKAVKKGLYIVNGKKVVK